MHVTWSLKCFISLLISNLKIKICDTTTSPTAIFEEKIGFWKQEEKKNYDIWVLDAVVNTWIYTNKCQEGEKLGTL
jgi:hypothetical protein